MGLLYIVIMKIMDKLLAHIFPPLFRRKWITPDPWFDRTLLEKAKPFLSHAAFGIQRKFVTPQAITMLTFSEWHNKTRGPFSGGHGGMI